MKHLAPKALAGAAAALAPLAVLFGCAAAPAASKPELASFVVLGEQGVAVARVLTSAAQCPVIELDGRGSAMDVRATAQTMPQRRTQSAAGDSKPSSFPVLTCEKMIPPQTQTALVEGRSLPLPKDEARRIVVIGDTGCRMKKSDAAYQPCNDAKQYPFAKIAALAAGWKPDLVLHVGDYHYRENACPDGNAGCAGSPWGYGWDAWKADFFAPATPLLHAAPWVMVRGNHESCTRAGQGWWRFMDPRPLAPGRDCNDEAFDGIGNFSDPYAVLVGGDAQFIVLDTSNTSGSPIPAADIRHEKYLDMVRKLDLLSRQAGYNIAVNHHPILGFTAKQKANGEVSLLPGDRGLQSVLAEANPLLLPPRVNVLMSGHVHVWQQVSFSSAHPSQFVAGFSGTMEDVVPLPEHLPPAATPAAGAVVEHLSSWVNGFGFMTLERIGAIGSDHWDVKVWDSAGKQVNACRIDGSKSQCELAQVK